MIKVQACLLSALLISGVAMAQENTQAPVVSTDSSKTFMADQTADQIRSNQLVGSDVVNVANDKVGSISDLVMDKDGQVVGIVVGIGGFLGMGEKDVALSWSSVEITTDEDNDNYQVMTPLEKEDFENAMEYVEKDEPGA